MPGEKDTRRFLPPAATGFGSGVGGGLAAALRSFFCARSASSNSFFFCSLSFLRSPALAAATRRATAGGATRT